MAALVADPRRFRQIARATSRNCRTLLRDPARRELIEHAYEEIAQMYWGTRLPVDEACTAIRAWLAQLS